MLVSIKPFQNISEGLTFAKVLSVPPKPGFNSCLHVYDTGYSQRTIYLTTCYITEFARCK